MGRWLRRGVIALLAMTVFSYVADWAVYRVQGAPTSKFMVSYFVTAQLKNKKEERDYLGSEEVPCSITLYPQGGMKPCWWLREHTNQEARY